MQSGEHSKSSQSCQSESLTAMTDPDCKLTSLLQFTRDWDKLRFASLQKYLFAALVLASPTCNRRCNGVYSSAVKERPSDQRYARWECKRPSGEWGAGAAGAEPGPKGAGAAQAGPGGAGHWIKQ